MTNYHKVFVIATIIALTSVAATIEATTMVRTRASVCAVIDEGLITEHVDVSWRSSTRITRIEFRHRYEILYHNHRASKHSVPGCHSFEYMVDEDEDYEEGTQSNPLRVGRTARGSSDDWFFCNSSDSFHCRGYGEIVGLSVIDHDTGCANSPCSY